ncbi:MAG: hypothetical protein GXO89_16215, partial [Chlorobi bacterium]|nr:hypothetical protein [Chlorobiota bacterium]
YETHPNYEEHAFEPIIFTLAGNFPFVSQKIDFQVKFRGFYINFNSYNGASPLKETNNSETRTKTFSFTDTDREKLEDTRFLFKYLVEPTIKFQVIYSSPKFKKTSKNFLGEIGVPKSQITVNELKEYVNRVEMANKEAVDYFVNTNCISLLRKYRKKDISKRRFLQDAYKYLQVTTLLDDGYDNLNYSINDVYFVGILKNLLDQKDIKNKIVVAIRRSTGNIENLLLTEELIWLLKVNIGKSVYYIFTPDMYSSIDDRYSSAEGAEAYAIISDKNPRNTKISKFNLPASSFTENTVSKSYEVSLTDMSIMDIESTTSAKGISKYDYFSSALIYDDYVPAKLKEFDIKEFPLTKNKGKLEEQKRKIKDRIAEDEKERKETFESLREQTFTLKSYDDFELLNNGLGKKNDSLTFLERFSVEDLIKKAGPNYLLEVGKFIGNQMELKEKEMVRTKDIWIGFAATYSYEISFNVPEGYQLQGIDKLSMTVENETGGFLSTAELEGNILKVRTRKFYKNIFEPKENWDKMVEFIEAAYDFTQVKLLMKKG